jgi:SNF2 family DNA or RNA helicase
VGGYDSIKEKLEKKPSIIMITYHQLPKVEDMLAKYISENEFFVFVDESHRMKRGYRGIHGKSVLSLSNIPEYKLILSGTPMPQGAEDLIPQFNFLFPEINVTRESVIDAIKPIYVRTTKDDLQLRRPEVKLRPVEMSESQRKLYELLRSEAARQAEELLKAKDKIKLRAMGRSVLRLIQLTSNPALLAKTDFANHQLLKDVLREGDGPKIKYVCNRARQLAYDGKKTIIWSSFVENVELIAERLADLGADYIHGGVDVGDEEDITTREAKIKKFHEDKNAYILVANPAAASEGISLHKVCHNAIYLDRNYNAAQFLQSMDRIHRVGLPKDIETLIDVVVCSNTIDDSVNKRLETKINLMAEVLNDSSLRFEYEYADEEIGEEISENDIDDAIGHILGKEI